jgi:hypothetical protein
MAETEPQSKDFWDKLSTFSALLAAVLVPLAVAFVGHWYTAAIQKDTSKRAWTQIGIDILRDPGSTLGFREWAIELVEKEGDRPFSDKVRAALTLGRKVLPQSSAGQQTSAVRRPKVVQQPNAVRRPEAVQAPMFDWVSSSNRVAEVDKLQELGISALLKRDIAGAVKAYDDAYSLWPTFRNVDEIRTILREAEGSKDGPIWTDVYRRISGMDLRGVPENLQEQLKAAAKTGVITRMP